MWTPRSIARSLMFALAACAIATPDARAQDTEPSPLVDAIRGVALDPTTYAPSILSYTSGRLDWSSSQVFFAHGITEHNPAYTLSGLPDDAPLSYEDGNRKVLRDALGVFQVSLLNNFVDRSVERVLLQKFPTHRRLIRALGWAERIAFASYLSYQSSSQHFRQWQVNGQVAGKLSW